MLFKPLSRYAHLKWSSRSRELDYHYTCVVIEMFTTIRHYSHRRFNTIRPGCSEFLMEFLDINLSRDQSISYAFEPFWDHIERELHAVNKVYVHGFRFSF